VDTVGGGSWRKKMAGGYTRHSMRQKGNSDTPSAGLLGETGGGGGVFAAGKVFYAVFQLRGGGGPEGGGGVRGELKNVKTSFRGVPCLEGVTIGRGGAE